MNARTQRDLKDYGREGLAELACSLGEPPFRASQIGRWLYREDVATADEMTNLPASIRTRLKDEFLIGRSVIEAKATSADGSLKLRIRLAHGGVVETVHLPTARRMTVCLSSQTGCPMECAFCATGRQGPGRTLTPGEMIEQLQVMMRPTPAGAGRSRPTHVVFMGMGEPLLDPRPLVTVIRVLAWEHGFGYAMRRITVSTCGIPDGIRALADSGLKVRLALSLHAPWEGLRASLMPKAPSLVDVLPALRYYQETTRATLTLEYVLLAGVNDTPSCARALGELAARLGSKINLISFNESGEGAFHPPSPQRVASFLTVLQPIAPTVTIRQSMGRDIAAACGQLAGTTPAGDTVTP